MTNTYQPPYKWQTSQRQFENEKKHRSDKTGLYWYGMIWNRSRRASVWAGENLENIDTTIFFYFMEQFMIKMGT
jgi:hypothetical protein